MEQKYNLKSPAVKRLMREAKELCDPTEQYFAQPLEDNLFEWHFTVQGASDSDFSHGRYHGRITLPPEYPMKPPSIMLLTPNGRFETGKKICLSMSAHHPETWQPSWSIRTVLLAIIGFMPTKGSGAIGALDYTPEERKSLAKKSVQWKCNVCGSCNADVLKEAQPGDQENISKEIEDITSQIMFKPEENNKVSDQSSENKTKVTEESTSNHVEQQGIEEVGQTTSGNVRKRVVKRRKRHTRTMNNNERNVESRTVTTFVIFLLIISILFLLLRRIFMTYYTSN